VPTQKAMASIENVLAGASAGDYFAAAQFYYQSNGDINKARTYIDKALEMSAEKPFYFTPEIIDFSEARR
jgi:Tfp pilus assembly protein PilF